MIVTDIDIVPADVNCFKRSTGSDFREKKVRNSGQETKIDRES